MTRLLALAPLALAFALGGAAARPAPDTVAIVVRHAEKAGPSGDVPLSPAGEARARALAQVAKDAGVSAIITTQFQRTRQTAAPLAAALHITPDVIEATGAAPEHASAVAAAIRQRYAGRSVLVVGHSNTVPAIVAALGGPKFPDLCDEEYDNVFVLEKPNANWQLAGKLARPLGYGVSVTYRDAVICVGGSDAERHYADAFRLEWKNHELVRSELPPLPKPVANACGALVDNTLYIAGGQDKPDATHTLNSVYRMDLSASNPAWQETDPLPGGGRMLAIAAAFDGAFWIIGGVDVAPGPDGRAKRRYLKDVFRFNPG